MSVLRIICKPRHGMAIQPPATASGTASGIHCPGCGRRATVAEVVCARCREFLPAAIKADLDASQENPALVPLVVPAVLAAVARGPLPPGGRPGMAPLLHKGNRGDSCPGIR